MSVCSLIGHDASIAVLNRLYNTRLKSLGSIVVHDNVFIGYGTIVLPGVTIGPNAIVGTGAVVTKDVRDGDIVGGNPARPIGKVEDLWQKLEKRTDEYPWGHLIRQREGGKSFGSSELDKEVLKLRQDYFFGELGESD